jgi:hypothetical protein
MRDKVLLTHKFVEFIPRELEPNTIYVSIPYATAIHNCCCGCGNRVVTPISPADWKFIFDGRSVSLDPSIGNWSFPCRSHYWIRNSRVVWADEWTDEKIAANRKKDAGVAAALFGTDGASIETVTATTGKTKKKKAKGGFKRRIKKLFGGKDA